MWWLVSFSLLTGCNTLTGLGFSVPASNLVARSIAAIPGPQFNIVTPTVNTTVPGISTLTGTCDAGSTFSIEGDVKDATVRSTCVSGNFTIPFQLSGAEGNHTVKVTGMLPSGASTQKTIQLHMPKPSMRGVNYYTPCGSYPGQWYTDSAKIGWDLDYLKARGQTLLRMEIEWEVLQPVLYGALTAWDVTCIHTVLNEANARSMKVIIDVHNYARYVINNNGGSTDASVVPANQNILLGTADLPIATLADLWTRLATEFNADPALYGYDLMNEPHDLPNATVWPSAAQGAINAIRVVDTVTPILYMFDTNWNSAPWTNDPPWTLPSPVTDPMNKLIYQQHIYFDEYSAGYYSGTYDSYAAYPNIGVDRAQPFIDWLNANHYKGLLGEFGAPSDDPRWLTVVDNFMNYVTANGVDMTAWSYGFMWEEYGQSGAWYDLSPLGAPTMPNNPVDRAQMQVLMKYPSTR